MINLLVDCSSPTLWSILNVTKKAFTLIQIIAPILLIISLIMNITKLVSNPEDKKAGKKIKNAILATIIIFFIPLVVNVLMNALGEDFSISSCWNSTNDEYNEPSYIDDTENSRKKIYDNSTTYEK